MKKTLIGIFMAFLALGTLEAQDFFETVAFDVDLAELSRPEVAEELRESGRIAILEGLMGSTQHVEDPASPRVLVELVGGAWVSFEEVRAYRTLIIFPGERWYEAFPTRAPRTPGPEYVQPGSRLLVAVRLIGFDEQTQTPLAEMVSFRVLN